MTKKLNVLILVSVFFLTALFFYSCDASKPMASIESEKMFSLNYGSFEDETKLYFVKDGADFSSDIYMSDGLFYISDSNSKKVLMLSSYGDLLAIYFNTDTNPVPSFIQLSEIDSSSEGKPSEKATQRATPFPFLNPEKITVDKRKYLYVSDYVPEERYETDTESNQLLRQIVYRFSNDGSFIDYIGQQGSGGMPFPYIKELYTTTSNELVVVCTDNKGLTAFWYNDEGNLLYKVPVEFKKLPVPESLASQDVITSLSSIVPDDNVHKLYLLIDYSKMDYDESSKVQFGITYIQSMLYPLDIETGAYEQPQVIPSYEQTINNDLSRQVYSIPYSFLGTTDSGWFFFTVADPAGCSLLMVNPDGQKILTRRLPINISDISYYTISLSDEGIISALLVEDKSVSVTWWRTDKIINSMNK